MEGRTVLVLACLFSVVSVGSAGMPPSATVTTIPYDSNTTPSLGQDFEIKCTVQGFPSILEAFWSRRPARGMGKLEHIFPHSLPDSTTQRTTPAPKYSWQEDTRDTRYQVFVLTIQSLTYNDDGDYVCGIFWGSFNLTDSYRMAVEGRPDISPMVMERNGIVGYHELITVEYITRPRLDNVTWYGPSGDILDTNTSRVYVTESGRLKGAIVLHITNFSRDDKGTYSVVLNNDRGEDRVEFEFKADPFLQVVTPNATTLPYGSTAVFICRATNFRSQPMFVWHHGWSKTVLSMVPATRSVTMRTEMIQTSNVTTWMSTATIRGINFNFIGVLECSASELDEVYVDSNTINVIGSPVIQSSMRSVGAMLGETVELQCNVSSNPPPTQLQWLFNSNTIKFQRFATNWTARDVTMQMRHVVEVTTINDFGIYMCQVTNMYGTNGYSIHLIGDMYSWCKFKWCPKDKLCDEDSAACVCPQGHAENKDGVCKESAPQKQAVETYVWGVVGASSVLVVTLAMGIVLYVCWKRRTGLVKRKQDRADILARTNAAYSHAQYATSNIYEIITRPSDEFPRERLRFLHALGVGKFGRVMKAEALSINRTGSWEDVAVKMCQESATDLDKEDLYNELIIIRKIPKHINVVSFYGACTYGEPLLLILEYIPGGDLRNYLRRRRPAYDKTWESPLSVQESPLAVEEMVKGEEDGELTAKDLLSFAVQTARGMQHLEANSIVHRDVAARNVLVGYNCVCKISDFGLARDVEGVDVYERTSKGPLPVRWMSPEALMEGFHSHKADVWAFGVLLWEIVTLGASPYSTMTLRGVIDAVVAGKRLERPQYCMDELYSLMSKCWELQPQDRPSFKELVQHVEYLLEKEADYIQLDQFQEAVYMVLEPDSHDEKL
ncbi:fibroblast growth factor receptor 3-like [Haliotis rufescens]|uniref:fibroblast growth factor receptor 3-like n=1 Tax=Haliotis rufescens TaxID=6454 RepID=UPI00201EE657|nr:fibroblast growth factor receptor 3-like [Haliotis rufescens]